jgi:hypothetical protein
MYAECANYALVVLCWQGKGMFLSWHEAGIIAWIFRQVDFRRGWSPEVAQGHGGLGVLDNSNI